MLGAFDRHSGFGLRRFSAMLSLCFEGMDVWHNGPLNQHPKTNRNPWMYGIISIQHTIEQ